MSDTDKCEDRIADHLASRMEDIEPLWEGYKNGEEEVEDLGSFHEYGLCFDFVAPGTFGDDQREGYFRYQLGCGGPQDEFRFFCGPGYDCHRIEYWFLDWFDGAHITLCGGRETTLMEIFDFFKECGTVEHQYNEAVA